MNEEQVMHAMGIDDAYDVVRPLARGRGGETELVTLDGSGPFVRKRIPAELANRRVWAALAGSTCPRLPRVAATYEMPDCFVVVYDFVSGTTLEQVVSAYGALPPDDAARTVAELCDAVQALHELGIIHRDIAPGNVIMAADGAHLIDLGIAVMLDEVASGKGKALGTWGFAAPEQYGFAQADERSDVYALGRLLGYLLCGIEPGEESFEERLASAEAVSAELRAVVLRASSFEPSARYQGADELRRAIEMARSVANEEGTGASPNRAASSDTTDRDSASSRSSGQRRTVQSDGASTQREDGAYASTSECASDAKNADADSGPEPIVVSTRRSPLQAVLDHLDARAERKAAERAEKRRQLMILLAGMALFIVTLIVFASCQADHERETTYYSQDPSAPLASAGSYTGDSSTDGEPRESLTEEAQNALAVGESGWSVDSLGYVYYAFALKNSSDDLKITLPSVKMTGYDEKGTVLFTESHILAEIAPGETQYVAGLATEASPNRVEFEIEPLNDLSVMHATGSHASYEVEGFTEMPGSLADELRFTGTVKRLTEGEFSSGTEQIGVTVILRDKSGKIVFGDMTLISRPSVGESTGFELSMYGAPDYAKAEAHVADM